MSILMDGSTSYPRRPYVPYVVPFGLFVICTYMAPLFNISRGLIYPIKTVLVAASLIYFWNAYKQEIRFSFSWLAVISGVFVFFIWVLPEGLYPQIGYSEFNPYEQASGYGVYFIIAFRLIGASLIVPLMEELFWRSFALRFVIKSDFKSIPLGQFSWLSFIFISLLFGFEHHRWLVGIVAGIVYAGVLYQSKNLFVPILAHAITNFLLGLYVLSTHQWSFW
jgi:CAAX prenyl protease-like protein